MTLRITLILVLGLTPLAAQTTKDVQDYLPLAVGNSWTYKHEFFDARSGIAAPIYLTAEFTISILRTEVIDGETYYVFSDISTTMPEGLPNHFLNGLAYQYFSFRGNPGSSDLSFYGDFGMYRVIAGRASGDMIVLRNTITAMRAVLQATTAQENGARDAGVSSSVTVEWEDFQCYFSEDDITYGRTCNYPPTSTSASSWGSIKDRSE